MLGERWKSDMADNNKKNLRISDMFARDEFRPLEDMLSEYRREMEKMKETLQKAGPEKKKPKKQPPEKSPK